MPEPGPLQLPEPPAPLADRPALGGETLRQRAARGTLVNGIFLVGVDSLGLIRGFIVAAFLSTSQYGVWGLLVVALGTLSWLKQVGISDKYVQQDDADQELAFQKAFTLELIFTGAFALFVAAAVPLFALLYGRWEIVAPGFVVLLAVPAAVLQTPMWVFYRRMEFARQRTLQAVDPIVGFVVTVSLAIAGAGYWSLIAGTVAGAWAGAVVALAYAPYRLAIRYEAGSAREYVHFSWPLLVAGLSGIAIAQSSIIAGEQTLGLTGVGIIALASSISFYTNRVDSIITQTLYPAICAVRDRTDLLLESFVKSNRLALLWGVPFGVGIALFAPDLVHFVLGEKWAPGIGLIQAFGGIAAANHIAFNWDAYFRARGDTRPIAIWGFISMLAFVAVAIPLLISDGLTGFAWGMGIATAVSLLVRGFFVHRLFPGFRMAPHALRAVAPTVPAGLAVVAVRALEAHDRSAGMAVGELLLFLLVTVVASMFIERALLREALGYMRRGEVPPAGAAASA